MKMKERGSAMDLSSLKVLCIEDNNFQMHLLCNYLTSLGIKDIVQTKCGKEGIDALNESATGFDAVISDLQMDEMDGIEFVRAADKTKARTIIFTSAHENSILASAEKLAVFYGLQVLGKLPKPINHGTLRKLLEEAKQRMLRPDLYATPHVPVFTDAAIEKALDDNQITAFYMPTFGLEKRNPFGVTVLPRWLHPEYGALAQQSFFNTINNSELMMRYTTHILKLTLSAISKLDKSNPLKITFNMSHTANDVTLPNLMASTVKQYGFSPELFTIMISEKEFAGNFESLREVVTRLRMFGFEIALNNFGSGHCSILQLGELPINELQIDRSYVHKDMADKRSEIILEALVKLAYKLEIRSVVEGIENEQQYNFFNNLAFDYGSGPYLGQAMTVEELYTFASSLESRQADATGTWTT
jgi:EAL domain-containing protein (putative c-di-GMP-specific phosphodiesterase class I)/CheY-like chemotaxis protein